MRSRQEIFEQAITERRQNTFGVKLHALNTQPVVANTHDLSVVSLRCNYKLIRQRVAGDSQRMITAGFKVLGQICEYALAVMTHTR